MLANMKVNKVADMKLDNVASMVPDMKVDKLAAMKVDMEVDLVVGKGPT